MSGKKVSDFILNMIREEMAANRVVTSIHLSRDDTRAILEEADRCKAQSSRNYVDNGVAFLGYPAKWNSDATCVVSTEASALP